VALTTALLPDLLARQRGYILNVASVAGFQPMPNDATYGASKAFVISFTEGLAEELRGTGIRVTALCPGPVTTEIFDRLAPGVARRPRSYEITPEACAQFALKAADAGRVIAIPGARNRLVSVVSRFVPRSWSRRVSGKVSPRYIGYDTAARSDRR